MNKRKYFLFAFSLLLLKHIVVAQESILDSRYDFSFNNSSIYEAFVEISQKTGYHFSYDASYIDSEKEISLSFKDKSLNNIITQIIDSNDAELKIVGNQIIISKPTLKQSDKEKQNLEIKIYPFIKIKGEVVDLKSKKPVPFATISIVGKSIGIITNENGNFILKIPNELQNDTLSIASLGYQSLEVPIKLIDTTYHVYELKQDFIPIQEVIIRKKEPQNLILSAVEKIPENYSSETELYTAFYRESIKKNRDYIAHSEAILFINKAPYDNEFVSDQVKVFKSRKTVNSSKLDTLILKLKGGLNTSLMLDLAKNPSNFLLEENFKFYDYNLVDIIIFDNQPTYVIEFDQKENINYPLFKGRLYIDIETYAIRGSEFSLSPHGIDNAKDVMVVKRSRKFNVRPLSANYMVKYREINGKFYVNHIRFETRFRVRRKKKLFSTDFHTISEMAINYIEKTDTKRFKYREIANLDDIFQDQIRGYDPAFWGHLNYLMPDKPLEDALREINEMLEK